MVYISGGNELLDAKKILKKLGVHEGAKVADLGCGGAGHFIIPAAKMIGKHVNAYAIDILKSVLSEVSTKARLLKIYNIKTTWANLEIFGSTKIKDNELDYTFLINILFQSKEHKNILLEAKRIMKKGGRLLIIDWNQMDIPFGPSLIDRVRPEDVRALAESLDFKFIEEFYAGTYHFGMILQK